MVEERVTDGRRIAELLASEVEGRVGALASLTVGNADRDAEPSVDGTHAYDVVRENEDADGDAGATVASAYLQPERVRLELSAAPERALADARERGLRARPRAGESPATLVFVESGAATKRAADLLGAVADGDDPE